VHLWGGVQSEAERKAIGLAARRSHGVAEVRNRLFIMPPRLTASPRGPMKKWFARRTLLFLGAWLAAAEVLAQPVTLTHVHGLAYSADGKKLFVPSNDGLAVFEAGRWSRDPGPPHDYMGFAATGKNIYSSGHPASGSGMANPFGLIRSRDHGKTWDRLGLHGESDFHLVAAGWNSGAVYVWNPAPNSRMRQEGLHYTLNDGVTWQMSAGSGLQGEPRALAVHPDKASLVAMATSTGIFESADYGKSFMQIAGAKGTAVFYDLDGKHLWYGLFDGRPRLARARLRSGPMAWIKLPPMEGDAVAYVAQNPASRVGYAIATFERNVYVSKDSGRVWSQIAERGVAR